MCPKLIRCLVCLWIALFPAFVCQSQADDKTINFQFTDVNNQTFSLSEFHGKWVIVNFFATWCPLCWYEVPTLNKLASRQDVVVIGVALDYGNPNDVTTAIEDHNLNYQRFVFGGKRHGLTSAFRQVGPVDFFPTSYLYDPNGELVAFIPGQLHIRTVEQFMNMSKYRK